jgi:hypothetical protein
MDARAQHRLTIGHLQCDYLVPRDHPAPENVRSELDEIARKTLAESCRRVFSAHMDEDDPSVWLIDNVRLDFLMDLGAGAAEDIAEFWARQVAGSVTRIIGRGEDGAHVIRFANRAEYLARFLRDLASGRAWGSWQYNQFSSLRSLPTPAAIREALRREPSLAEPVLLCLLRADRLDEVIAGLSSADREMLLEVCAPDSAPLERPSLAAALAIWRDAPAEPVDPLLLFLLVRDALPESTAGGTRRAVETVAALDLLIRRSRLDQALSVLGRRTPAESLAGADSQEVEAVLCLDAAARDAPEFGAAIASAAEGRLKRAAEDRLGRQPRREGVEFASPFGGVFLLLPALLADRELLDAFGRPGCGRMRHLLLLTCLPHPAAEAAADPAIRLAAGIDDPQPPVESLSIDPDLCRRDLLPGDYESCDRAARELLPDSLLREQLAAAVAAVMRSTARRLPGLGKSSFDYLWRNVIAGGSTVASTRDRIAVRLDPRPLDIVLRLAGFNALDLAVPWLPETQVTVRFGEQ